MLVLLGWPDLSLWKRGHFASRRRGGWGAGRVLHAALSDQNDSFLYSQSSRKKVERKGDTLSWTCKGVIVGERPRETRISNEAKSQTILESLPDAFLIPRVIWREICLKSIRKCKYHDPQMFHDLQMCFAIHNFFFSRFTNVFCDPQKNKILTRDL